MLRDFLTADQVWQFAQEQPFYTALFMFMVLDVITGILCAFYTKQLSSDLSLRGMAKKMMMWGMVFTAIILGWLTRFDGIQIAGYQVTLGAATASSFIVVEVLSIFENAGQLGILPPWLLRDQLSKLNTTEINVKAPSSAKTEVNVGPAPDTMVGGSRKTDPPLEDRVA